ncbi:unnamed protein product [Calypogeia fissa]
MESMDLVDSDTSGIPLTTSTSIGDGGVPSSSYAMSYLESFLPAYEMVNQSTVSGVADRYRAIKFAADASLALVASGASWSDALTKTLVEDSDRGDFSGGDEFLRSGSSILSSSSSEASISSQDRFPDLDGSNFFCDPSGSSFETVSSSLGRKLGAHNLSHRNHGLGGRSMPVLQRFGGTAAARNWRRNHQRHHQHSRDADRLAILRSLSSKCKSKRRLLRRSSKPKAVLRKVKSLARSRRRLPVFPTKSVERIVEPSEQMFENGLAALQRLVPGGSNMDADVLLDEAADFVVFLKLQVQALQSVANAVGIDS